MRRSKFAVVKSQRLSIGSSVDLVPQRYSLKGEIIYFIATIKKLAHNNIRLFKHILMIGSVVKSKSL